MTKRMSAATFAALALGLSAPVLAQPVATNLGTLTQGTPVDVAGIPISAGSVVWYQFTVPAVADPVYLDIDTEGTFLSTSNDTEIGLYDSAGNVVAVDDDNGSGLLSQLSFGATAPARPAVGSGAAYNGRNGPLAAGTYYLALGSYNTTFNLTNWDVTSISANTGTAQLRLRLGAIPPPVAPTAIDLGTLTAGTSINVTNIPVNPASVAWYTFTIPDVAVTMYLDIDTDGSALSGNDSEIGVYDASGLLKANDDDDGPGGLSALSFGAGSPARPGSGDGVPFAGQDGPLAAGTYYIAVGAFNVTFNATRWDAQSTSSASGTAQLNLRLGNAPPPPAGTFIESGDAGETVSTAQAVTGGSGNVPFIMGSLSADTDVYVIQICDAAGFSATTDQGTAVDTQMFLFTADGHGVVFNDDIAATGTVNRQSRITGAFVPGPGTYLLAVCGYNRDPQDAGNQLLWNNSPFDGERAPDGPGAANPMDHWVNSGGTGSYMITLTGVCYGAATCPVDIDNNGAVEPADVAAFITRWFASLQGGTLAGDFDGNGAVEPSDVASFVGAWFQALTQGC